jgi:hypothetical protein
MGSLEVDPELWRRTKIAAEPDGRIRRHVSSLTGDIADPVGWYIDGGGERTSAYAERNQKLLSQDFAGMNADTGHLLTSGMIVDDIDVGWPFIGPAEADPPLLIHSDATPPDPVALEWFQPVTGRRAHVFELQSLIEHVKFPQRYLLD